MQSIFQLTHTVIMRKNEVEGKHARDQVEGLWNKDTDYESLFELGEGIDLKRPDEKIIAYFVLIFFRQSCRDTSHYFLQLFSF